MNGTARSTVPLVAFALLLAGCSAGEGEPAATPLFDAKHGAVRGMVTDEELRPLPGALVTLNGTELQGTTDATGSYSLPLVPPGTFELVATAPGHEPGYATVAVRVGEVATTNLLLKALPAEGEFAEIYPFTGYEACQWYVPFALAHCSVFYTILVGTVNESVGNPGLPPDVQDNRDKYLFPARPDAVEFVSELVWHAASSAATYQALVLACPWYNPSVDECVPPGETHTGERYMTVVGTNPIRVQWTHPDVAHLEARPEVLSRANVNGNTTEVRPAGFALDQRIEMYNTVFYGMAAPEGYSAGPPES